MQSRGSLWGSEFRSIAEEPGDVSTGAVGTLARYRRILPGVAGPTDRQPVGRQGWTSLSRCARCCRQGSAGSNQMRPLPPRCHAKERRL